MDEPDPVVLLENVLTTQTTRDFNFWSVPLQDPCSLFVHFRKPHPFPNLPTLPSGNPDSVVSSLPPLLHILFYSPTHQPTPGLIRPGTPTLFSNLVLSLTLRYYTLVTSERKKTKIFNSTLSVNRLTYINFLH